MNKTRDGLLHFLHTESLSGLLLLACALAALAWANSPVAASYTALWGPLHFWVNDVLMTLFFFVIGLELRIELAAGGALRGWRRASLPMLAALGGVAVPAGLCWAINAGTPGAAAWAIPTATDIAFSVGVLALLGARAPAGLRVLLLALAIVDDLLAVVIIAVLSSDASAGVHPALAGVVLGLCMPGRWARGVRDVLHPWVAFVVMPVFALANAGVPLAGADLGDGLAHQVFLGVAVALVLGKPLGIVAAVWLAVRFAGCRLPPDVQWRALVLMGVLAGIGFTMSLFIADLSLRDEALLTAAKLGVLAGSALAAVFALAWSRVLPKVRVESRLPCELQAAAATRARLRARRLARSTLGARPPPRQQSRD
jgi:NhaA family Na+:H+ antiporter